MPLHVQGEVVRAGEGPLAHLALEWPVPRVLPRVPGELVRTGKPPSASLPRAQVGLLPRVRPLMGLQVARLGIGLDAALDGAGVDDLLPLGPVPLSLWLVGIGGGLGTPLLLLGRRRRGGRGRGSDLACKV